MGKDPVVDVGDDLRPGFLGAEHWSEIFLKVKKLPNDNFRIFLLLEIVQQGFFIFESVWMSEIHNLCDLHDSRS